MKIKNAYLAMKVSKIVDCVIKIIEKISKQTDKVLLMDNNLIHIDITLLKDEKFNWIQLTNCGQLNNLNFKKLIVTFKKLIRDISIDGVNDETIAICHWKTLENNYEIVFDLKQLNNDGILSEIIHFPYLNEYLSLKIEHKLTRNEVEKFKKILVEQLLQLHIQYPDIKYTFHSVNNELLFSCDVEFDNTYTQCQLLSSTITQILKFSSNDNFRKKCFELVNIDHSEMVESSIMTNLLPIFNNNYQM